MHLLSSFKAGSDASARGFLPSSQLAQFYPVNPPKYPQVWLGLFQMSNNVDA